MDAVKKPWEDIKAPWKSEPRPPIVAFYAPQMQSGKTTAANYLVRKNRFVLHKFAGPLKEMLHGLFKALGVDPYRALEGDLKETPLPQLGGKTPRFALQSLGTEWGRNTVYEDIWVDIAMNRIITDNEWGGWSIVVDDLRLPNEYAALAALPNTTLVKIIRPGETPYSAHGSEGLLEGHTFDFTIINDSTPEDLCRKVETVLHLGPTHGARATGKKEIIVDIED